MQLAAYRSQGGLAALLKGNGRRQAEQDEEAVANTGIPYTIVRPGALRDEPGGQLGFQFAQVFLYTIWSRFPSILPSLSIYANLLLGCMQGESITGTITREDAAAICVRALSRPPQKALIFEVPACRVSGAFAILRLLVITTPSVLSELDLY